MPRRAAVRHRSRISPGRRIYPLLLADDFGAALTAAGLDPPPDRNALEAAAAASDLLVQAVLSSNATPSIGVIRGTGEALAIVEAECTAALAPILAALPAPVPESEPSLAGALAGSRDPLVVALLDAAAALDGGDGDARLLSSTLLAVDRLRNWARASKVQFEAGLQRERMSRSAAEAQSPARNLGLALIQIYVELSGRPPGFSRSTRKDGETHPTGPLIRYLDHLFQSARKRLSAIPEQGELARDRAWAPSGETLAVWIKEFRKQSGD